MKFCQQCGTQLSDTAVVCPNCGTKAEPAVNQGPDRRAEPQYGQPQYGQPYAPAPNAQQQYTQQQYAQPQYIPAQPVVNEEAALPEKYRPLSPLAYFGYSLLFSIPIVGFIFAIIYAVTSEGNINRRNYARGYLIALLVGVIIYDIILVITLVAGVSISALFRNSRYYY